MQTLHSEMLLLLDRLIMIYLYNVNDRVISFFCKGLIFARLYTFVKFRKNKIHAKIFKFTVFILNPALPGPPMFYWYHLAVIWPVVLWGVKCDA